MEKKILVYNMPQEKLEVLSKLGEKYEYEIVVATDEDLGKNVGFLVGDGTKIENSENAEPVDINFLMMHNFSKKDLNDYLEDMKRENLYIKNKCISTDTSKGWTLAKLLRENKAESDFFDLINALESVRSAGRGLLSQGIKDENLEIELANADRILDEKTFDQKEMIRTYNSLAKIVNAHIADNL